MCGKVDDSKTTLLFRQANTWPGCFGGLLGIKIRSPLEIVLPIFVYLINDLLV